MASAGRRTEQVPFIPAVDPFVQAVLLHGVRSVDAVSASEWRTHLERIVQLRLGGVALSLALSPGQSPGDDVVAALRRAARAEAAHALVLEAFIPELADRLASSGVEWLLLKGPTLAHLDPRLASRAFGDLDVMVDPRQMRAAADALVSAGFAEELEGWEPRADLPYKLRHSVSFRRGRIVVDLHRCVPPTVYGGRMRYAVLAADSRRIQIGGRTVRAPSLRHATIIAALHVLSSEGGRRVRPWRDAIVLLSRRDQARELRDELAATGLLRPVGVVASALTRAWGVPMATLNRGGGRARVRRTPRLWAMDWRRSWSDHQLAEMIRMPLGWAVRFLVAFLFPHRRSVANRYGAHGAGLVPAYLRWWRDLVGRAGRVLIGKRVPPRLPDGLRARRAAAPAEFASTVGVGAPDAGPGRNIE